MNWFTSDTHLGDDRLFGFANTKKPNLFFRHFHSVEEQDLTLISRINKVVGVEDHLYHLGDVAVDGEKLRLLDKLKVRKRTLIVGNYDEDKLKELSKYFDNIFYDYNIEVEPLVSTDPKIKTYLNHYPTKVLDVVKTDENQFGLFGHIHRLNNIKTRSVNVGCDLYDYYPISETQVSFMFNAIKKGYYDKDVFAI